MPMRVLIVIVIVINMGNLAPALSDVSFSHINNLHFNIPVIRSHCWPDIYHYTGILMQLYYTTTFVFISIVEKKKHFLYSVICMSK